MEQKAQDGLFGTDTNKRLGKPAPGAAIGEYND